MARRIERMDHPVCALFSVKVSYFSSKTEANQNQSQGKLKEACSMKRAKKRRVGLLKAANHSELKLFYKDQFKGL